MLRKILTFLNKLLPKYNHVIIQGFPIGESSAIEVANYISVNFKTPVYYAISTNKINLKSLGIINEDISFLNINTLYFRYKYLTAKYLFFTHGSPLSSFSKRQTAVNLWHGILYKNVGLLNNHSGVPAHVTVGTSNLTRTMFSEAFGVNESDVYISGYPRNDALLRTKNNKNNIIRKIGEGFETFDKVIIWLPTYRKSVRGDIRLDGIEVDNPFYIKDFDVERFNQVLRTHNTLCIIKPHPMAPAFEHINDLENLKFINDKWVLDKGITLYQLVGCTDILISDVSSIIIDYMLIDKPIVCVSTDFEEYKDTRGFYFKDIENWIPTKVIKEQDEFIKYISLLLNENKDPYENKRRQLKDLFFTNQDDKSTKRLVDYVLKEKVISIREHEND